MKDKTKRQRIWKMFQTSAKRFISLSIPFVLMDIFIGILVSRVNYYQPTMAIPNFLFRTMWIVLVVGIVCNLRTVMGRIVYGFSFALFFVAFLSHSIYFPYTGFFFRFSLLLMAKEGSSYVLDTILNTSPYIYIAALAILTTAILVLVRFPKQEKRSLRNILAILGAFIVLHTVTPFLLGEAHKTLEWDTWRNPRNVYQNFNDSNKCMKICGLYEYTFRDFYVTFLKPEPKASDEEKAFLKEAYAVQTEHDANGYTGILEGKNLIFLQLEGIDTWLLTPDTMPNLYALCQDSLQFINHYSYYTGGGSTFNSELAVNTGFLAPISYHQNAYSFTENLYVDTMPKRFQALGYRVNVFHMNTGEYYSRKLNYQNWGYDQYYGLLDVGSYKDASYELDRELILNEVFYEKLFLEEEPFVHYIITYTPHTPYDITYGKGQLLAAEQYAEQVPKLSEEACARLYATETDRMVGLLMDALKNEGLYENTVIVAYADHYLYTLNDKSVLETYKETGSNLINKTPFFIWSNDLESAIIKKVNSQLDILPTVFNLFGIAYVEEFYIGKDIMDSEYDGYVFFGDFSWYDGNLYVENGEVIKGIATDPSYVIEMNGMITQLIYRNDLTQKYDYFRQWNKANDRDYGLP